ncbi:MAG: IS30 family transposase [Isosphaeraceae bacterium]
MVRRLRGEGMTWQKAARAVGCSFTSAWFIGEGRGGRRARPASWTPRPGSLTIADREEITIGLVKGESFTAIAQRINKVPSTVSREVAANGGRDDYRAWAGYLRAEQRCRRPKPTKLASCPELLSKVTAGLEGFWSPQEISRRLRIDFADDPMMQVSHETIYQSLFVQARGELRRELTRCLRSGRAIRRPQGSKSKVNFRMPNMVMISERPAEVADRAVPGHWEGDLIMGKDNLSAVGTLVERSTRYTLLLHLGAGKDALSVKEAMKKAIRTLPSKLVKTITWDQGGEMGRHVDFTIETNIPVYFCDPHSPWQRGSNENTNGLLRQYMPKGTDLSVHSEKDLAGFARSLNDRPRMTLGYLKPSEKLAELIALTP